MQRPLNDVVPVAHACPTCGAHPRDASFVRLLEEVAAAESAAVTATERLQVGARAICRWTGWPLGHAYQPDAAGGLSTCDWWEGSGADGVRDFAATTASLKLAAGVGLPGRVAARSEPAWIRDVTVDQNFPRALAARAAGLHGAFAFGVGHADELFAVLEFFSRDAVAPDERLLEVSAYLGAQLGRSIAAHRAAQALRASEERLRSLTESAMDAIVAADVDDRIISWNAGARTMFGYEADEVLGRPVTILMPECFRADHEAGVKRIVEHGEAAARILGATVEVAGVRKDGEEFPLEMSLGTWAGDAGRYFIGVLRDITARKQAEQRISQLLEAAPDAIVELDADGRITLANAQAEALLDRPREQLIGLPAADFVIEADRELLASRFVDALGGLAAQKGRASADTMQASVRREDAAAVPVDIAFRPLQTATGPAVTVILRDATERRRFERDLRHMADHDALTGLYNRRRFETELEAHVAHTSRYGTGALLFLDLDGFKYVNDTYGHRTGDQLIQAVGGLISRRLRRSDVCARLGGDEFALLLPHADVDQARTIADDLLAAIRDLRVAGVPHASAKASVGVVSVADDGADPEQLLVCADLAMYEAKEAGGDRVVRYDGAATRGLDARLKWTERIHRALAEDGFILHAQPIFDLRAGAVTQFELLLRLPGDDGQLIPPVAFIEVAERLGLIAAIDRWVTGQAIDLIADHRRRNGRLCLEVNLSGKTIGDPALLEMVRNRLAETSIDPANLVFEITETAAIANMQQAREFAQELTDLGCRFALDDFGAGFSSFAYLKHLPLHYIKIDGDFIRSLTHSTTDQLVVKAMVEIAHGMGMQTIAEYVEDADTVAMLHAHGVDYAQGYYHGRPGPVDEVLLPAGARAQPARRATSAQATP